MKIIKMLLVAAVAILPTGAEAAKKAKKSQQPALPVDYAIYEEVHACPEKAGGVYLAYPFTTDSMPAIPEGFEPVYLSHYGRHGSRWIINRSLAKNMTKLMHEQAEKGNLTETGKKVLKQIDEWAAHTEGHLGELSPLGERQHKAIAGRMMERFPTLFAPGKKIVARSSVEPRCIISMAAASEEMMARNPELIVERHATPSDMDFIAGDTPLSEFHDSNEAPWRKPYYILRDSMNMAVRTASKIFINVDSIKNLPSFSKGLFDIAVSKQDVDGLDNDLLSLIEPEELYNLFKSHNFQMYIRHGRSKQGESSGPLAAVSLLDNLVDDADAALAGKRTGVDLRYGHDTCMLRLFSLACLNGADVRTDTPDSVAAVWRTFTLTPMAANLQLAFFRNAAGETIVSVRHNERPAKIGDLKEYAPGFYRWEDLRRFWKSQTNPVAEIAERVAPGSSKKILFELTKGDNDFFVLGACEGRPIIKGNSPVNIAAGLNWYLKYYTGNHLSWNNMRISLPDALPLPQAEERHSTEASRRYYLNYCTHSYSMAFWDWERWQQEIDWMALHGINMPLAITGIDLVWKNTLSKLGYSRKEIDSFVAGPAFQAWWLMNNLEGWGGPNTKEWYESREKLARRVVGQMRHYGMEPVLPGYAGMVPHDADTRMGLDVSGKGIWNGFTRPAFLQPSDPAFARIAKIYYSELEKVLGTSRYYSMDPFHEGGSTEGVDLRQAGSDIAAAMKLANPEAVWVIQGWNENPRAELLSGVKKGDILVLDLASEIKPNWGDPDSPSKTKRASGYDGHDWLFCMLLNFGGNVGLHGRFDNVIGGYYKALGSEFGKSLRGVGLTPEGIENNPVMYELLSELIWRPEKFAKEDWLKGYVSARYGSPHDAVQAAWCRLANTIYNCPWGNLQQGCTESVFCARPSDNVWQVSSWSRMAPYYEPQDVIDAAKEFAKGASEFRNNANYRYDLVDITRQAIAEKGRITYRLMQEALEKKDMKAFRRHSDKFLGLIGMQEELLSTRSEFHVQKWIDDARRLAESKKERKNMERNARLLITTWGPREASEAGKLRDYAHREWGGLLGTLYLKRWKRWVEQKLAGDDTPIDFYAIDEEWVNSRDRYELSAADCVDVALKALKKL